MITHAALRQEWAKAGGSVHGPKVETVTMPEADYIKLRKKLAGFAQDAIAALRASCTDLLEGQSMHDLAPPTADLEKTGHAWSQQLWDNSLYNLYCACWARDIIKQALFMEEQHGLCVREGIHSTLSAACEGEDIPTFAVDNVKMYIDQQYRYHRYMKIADAISKLIKVLEGSV